MVDLASLNPLSAINLGGSWGTFGSIALVIGVAFAILGLGAIVIYWRIVKKQYWINIEVSRLIGGVPMRVANYQAKEVPFGMAGDKLWRVGSGFFKFIKAVKWLPVGKVQSAPRLWKYWIREDGEWINYQDANLDEVSRKMGVRFVNEDMRLQRLATERLLEQRLMNKTFWEKWGTVIMTLIFFLVMTICMVIMFYQFSKVMDKFSTIATTQAETSRILLRVFGDNYIANAQNITGVSKGLIPV